MTSTMINERINNAQAKVAKKEATITKKLGWIAKKESQLATMPDNERLWAECDIKIWKEDIERNKQEIAELKVSIDSYKLQLGKATETEDLYIKEVPSSMKRMEADLIEQWDAYDKKKREECRGFYKAFGYKEFRKKYSRAHYELMYKTDDDIHRINAKDARALVIDLYRRVRGITGEVTNWDGIEATQGTWGFTVLNGTVQGKQGKCKVESIFAGGYNIQRLHIRVLTHEIN